MIFENILSVYLIIGTLCFLFYLFMGSTFDEIISRSVFWPLYFLKVLYRAFLMVFKK